MPDQKEATFRGNLHNSGGRQRCKFRCKTRQIQGNKTIGDECTELPHTELHRRPMQESSESIINDYSKCRKRRNGGRRDEEGSRKMVHIREKMLLDRVHDIKTPIRVDPGNVPTTLKRKRVMT